MSILEGKVSDRDKEILMEATLEGRKAKEKGNHPFGAVLADKEGHILLRAGNTVTTEHNDCGHAETNLMIAASKTYSREFLKDCTLYTSVEPCAMCSGAMYWTNVGRLVFALSEHQLLELTGDDPENQTFDLPCREVLSRGQKDIEVIGPVESDELVKEIVSDHKGFWNPN
ncbi:nucleoside deaminase [Oceanispirochaeta crateris]|nr:nucleoside deaminase [Oceanispirochaeta crateris]